VVLLLTLCTAAEINGSALGENTLSYQKKLLISELRQKIARLSDTRAWLKDEEEIARAELARLGSGMLTNGARAVRWGRSVVIEYVGAYELRYPRETGSGGLVAELWNIDPKIQVKKFVEGGEMFFGDQFVGVLFGALLIPRSTKASGFGWRHLILAQAANKVRECNCLSETTASTHASHVRTI
jgi:hypothetical protein